MYLSAGDLLREERSKEGSANADLINNYIREGKIVPVDITVGLIKTAMANLQEKSGVVNFLIDGFPRSLENNNGWNRVFKEGKDANVQFMLFFECPLKILEERILGRAKFSGRKDDNVESLRLRFQTYRNETMPIVDQFRQNGKVIDIDSSKERQDVWNLVKDSLSTFTDVSKVNAKLTEQSECMLGLRKWPKKDKKKKN